MWLTYFVLFYVWFFGGEKWVILAPWAAHSTYLFMMKDEEEKDLGYFLIFPFLILRMLHNQIWISVSRHRTAKGSNRIVDKGIEFEQVDRESNWSLSPSLSILLSI